MGKSKSTQSNKSKLTRSPWLTAGSQHAVSRAREIADRDYEAFGGQRIADLSQNEQMGVDMARSNVGMWEGDFQTARDTLGSIGSITDEGALDAYMNPYMDKVVNPALRRKNEAFEAERAARRAKRGMSGAFGGRGQMWDNKFASDFQRDQDEFMGEAYGRAFDKATSLFSQEQDRKLATAGAYQQLGTGAQQQRRADLRDLMTTGLTSRTRDQAEMDFKYLEYLEERDWDVTNLDSLVRTLQAVPHDYEQTSQTTTTESSSPLKTLAGVGAVVGGAILTGGASLAAGGSFMTGVGAALTGSADQIYGAAFPQPAETG